MSLLILGLNVGVKIHVGVKTHVIGVKVHVGVNEGVKTHVRGVKIPRRCEFPETLNLKFDLQI